MKKIIATVAIGAALLTGCSRGNDRYADVVCVDRTTEVRVDDWRCNSNNPSFIPWYLTAGQSFGYGQRALYGSSVVPQGYQPRTITVTPPGASPVTTKPSATPKPSTQPKATQAPKVQTAKPAKPKPAPAKPARPR